MAELSFSSISLVAVILFFQIEMFFAICYNNVIFFSKILKIKATNAASTSLILTNASSFYYYFFALSIVTLKGDSGVSVMLLLFVSLFILKLDSVLSRLQQTSISNNTLQFTLPLFSGFLYVLYFIDSYLTLFFFIEVYGVLYYFCFLTSYNFTSQTILKYKNGLLMLLWNNFLTTFLLGLGCFFLIQENGTSSFTELTLLTTTPVYTYIFLIGLAWKLGLPIFHFFKLEVYKYLLRENVYMFSILTTLINLVILYFCLSQDVIYTIMYTNNYLIFVIVFALNLVLINLTVTNILHFFAISGVLTMTTLLVMYLI